MHEYVADSNPAEGRRRVYRMNRVEMERHGRWRSFRQTLAVVVALFVLQYPINQAALGDWRVAGPVSPGTSARLGLLVDLAMIGAYLTLAWRALELTLAWSRRTRLRFVAHLAGAVVALGAVLDVAEGVVLWREAGDAGWDGDLVVTWSVLMRSLVLIGLSVLLMVALFAWWRWGKRPPTPETVPEEVSQPDRVICCSGGGVRSASFCLGGLQELTAEGLYADTDRVIGVSGGGYIAAAHHTVRWHSGTADEDVRWAELDPPAFAPDTPEVQRLRRNSRYLLDSGSSALQGLLSLLFGIVVNLVLLTAVLGATAWLLGWYLVASGGLSGWDEVRAASLDFPHAPWDWVLRVWLVPAAGVLLFALEKLLDKYWTAPFEVRIWLRRRSRELVTWGVLLVVLLLGTPILLAWMHDFAASSGSAVANLLHALGFVPDTVCLAQLTEGKAACGVAPADPLTPTQATRAAGGSASVASLSTGGAAAVVAAVLAVIKSARSTLGDTTSAKGGSRLGGVLTTVWSKVKATVLPWAAAVLVIGVLVVLLLRWTAGLVAAPERLASWNLALGYLGAVVGIRLLTDANRTSLHHFYRERLSFAFIVRRTRKGAGPLPYKEPLRFSESRPPRRRKGPRLVACAVANINDPGLVPVGRGCAPFVFDDTRIGLTDQQLPSGAAMAPSQLFEYAADRRFRDATIPAAMAMSGAAFSPLAGRQNARLNPYRLVLALANARLGVWLPNPLWIDDLATVRRLVRTRDEGEALRAWSGLSAGERGRLVKDLLNKPDQKWLWDLLPDQSSRPSAWARPDVGDGRLRVLGYRCASAVVSAQSKPGPGRLLTEAIGRTSVYDRRLYITDGGHYDNLGLVEALRRRPKEIFVLDASADAEDTFAVLGQAIATARMDLNCEVTFDPRSMRRLQAERSTAAWGNGRYRFEDGTEGAIRMVKVIMVEGLPWDVEAYSASHPTFPRTGTGDQLYNEFDLEAYRVLGREATRTLIANPPPELTDPPGRLTSPSSG